MKNYDAIIIGAGQAGVPLAKKFAKKGWNTVLIEKDRIGGTCINVGCTPSKSMIASAKRMYDCLHAKALGVQANQVKIDIKEVIAHKNKIVNTFREGAEKGLEKTDNLEVLFGKAEFTGLKRVKISLNSGGMTEISADKIFIDAGARPAVPDLPGLDKVPCFDSTTMMDLEEIPEHLLIIGAGYIGLEFGQMYRRFGSRVTVIEENERFLPKEDKDVADCIRDFLDKEKIEILSGTRAIRVKKENGKIRTTIQAGKIQKDIYSSHIFVAAGRIPNSDLLEAEKGGIKLNDKGFILVNDRLETTAKDVYALGDIKGGPAFTHLAYHDHLIVYKNLTCGGNHSFKDRQEPYTMFTDPQLGRIGLTEDEALEKRLEVQTAVFPMSKVGRAIEHADTRGMMKAVVDARTGQILGAAVIGEQGGEIMTILQMAMLGKIPWQAIRELPIAHPLYAEALNNLFMQLEDQA